MGVRDTCPRCGRGGSGKQNLITRQDVETQAVYLDQRGYFFRNPYWNITSVPKILPEPYYYEDIIGSDLRYKSKANWGHEHTDKEKKELEELIKKIGLAIKERKKKEEEELKEKFIKLRENHYIPGAIHKDANATKHGFLKRYDCGEVILYEFRYRWIYTNKILTHLPYSMRESLKESTFFLKPMNEQEFAPHALTERWEPRLKICGYGVNDENEWEKIPDDLYKEKYKHLNREEPSKDIVDNFLIKPCYKIWEWREQYITPEVSRTWYKQDYLDDLKEFLKDFASDGKWGMDYKWDVKSKEKTPSKDIEVRREYEQMRILMYAWGNVIVRHLESHLDNTRQGYICYLPATFTTFSRAFDRINDERLIFTMIEDQVANWYPRLFDVDNVIWQFVTRPMTKLMFEEFNEENIGGQVVKLPVQSCVFCPAGRGMSSSTNDDEHIVQPNTLIGTHEDNSEAWKGRVENWKERTISYDKLVVAEEASEVLNAITHDPKLMRKVEGRELENIRDIAKGIRGNTYIQNLSNSTMENLNQTEDIINAELNRRDDVIQRMNDEKDFLEKKYEQLENQQIDHENDRGIAREQLREVEAEKKRIQNDIRNVNQLNKDVRQKMTDCNKDIRETLTNVDRLTSQVNQARADANRAATRAEEDRLRAYADKLQGELEAARTRLDQHRTRLAELQRDFDNNREKIEELRGQYEDEREKAKLLDDEVKRLTVKINTPNPDLNEIKKGIENQKNKLLYEPTGGSGGGPPKVETPTFNESDYFPMSFRVTGNHSFYARHFTSLSYSYATDTSRNTGYIRTDYREVESRETDTGWGSRSAVGLNKVSKVTVGSLQSLKDLLGYLKVDSLTDGGRRWDTSIHIAKTTPYEHYVGGPVPISRVRDEVQRIISVLESRDVGRARNLSKDVYFTF